MVHAQGVYTIGRGLKVFPQQKNPHDLHAQLGNQGKIGIDFTRLKVFPPAHSFAPWP
jgi:hypothetical protein